MMMVQYTGINASRGIRTGTLKGDERVAVIELSRPERANAFDESMWHHLPQAVRELEAMDSTRCILILGAGENFCSGIDKNYLKSMMTTLNNFRCPGRMREFFRTHICWMQDAFTALEKCKWPIIAAVQGACIGGGVDLICACDIRICSSDAKFAVKEVDLAITADLGSLQRLPHVVGQGATADLALTARTFGSQEAHKLGLVTQVFSDRSKLLENAKQLAKLIASKSPMAIIGTKRMLLHNRDSAGGVPKELEYVATYNAGMLISKDLQDILQSRGGPVAFSKL